MRDFDSKKTACLIRLLMAENSSAIYKLSFVLPCVFMVVGWILNLKDLEQAIGISVSSMIAIICIHPVMIYLSAFLNRKANSTKLLVPASALEKYVSFWGAGLLLSLLWLVVIPVIMGALWMLVGISVYDRTTDEVALMYMASFKLPVFAVAVMCAAGFVLGTIVCQLRTRLRYIIPICFFCVIVGGIVLASFLSDGGEAARSWAMVVISALALFVVLGSVIWGYSFFKKIQFINQ